MTEQLKQKQAAPMSAKREIKLKEILNAAACQMNEWGVTTVSLNKVAKVVGLSRNALYYYFKDRRDLISACYELSSEMLATDLEEAIQSTDGASERIENFVKRRLSFDRQEQAILSDLDILPEPQRSEIHALHQKNIRVLETIIQEGIDREELRPVNTAIAAQVLLGMLSWTQLWQKWNGINAAAAKAMNESFLRGISTNRDYPFECPVSVQALRARPVNLFDQACIGEEKRLQLIGVSSLLFNQKGIDATSLEDIAEHIGASKGSIYHYFKDKPSLVNACYIQAFEQYELFVKIGQDMGKNGLDQVLIALHLNCQAQASKNPPLILQRGISSFSEDYNLRAQKLVDQYQLIRSRAIKDGSYRDGGKTSVELSAGAFFWIQNWLIEHPSTQDLQLADAICEIISGGIVRRG